MTDLTQKTVTDVRQMTRAEFETEGWHRTHNTRPVVIVFDDGTKIYPAADPEGNGPGALFGIDNAGTPVGFSP
jgi:hypothetical protein